MKKVNWISEQNVEIAKNKRGDKDKKDKNLRKKN